MKTERDEVAISRPNSLKFERGRLVALKKRHKIVKRMETSMCKEPYSYTKEKLDNFFAAFDETNRRNRFLLNMDETSIYFELEHKQTLDFQDTQHVGIGSEGKEKKRWAIVLTVGHCPYRTNHGIVFQL